MAQLKIRWGRFHGDRIKRDGPELFTSCECDLLSRQRIYTMCSFHLSSVIKEIQRRANSIKRASSDAVYYPLGPLFVLYNVRLLVHVSALSSPVLCHPILISTVRIKNRVEYNERNHTVLLQSRVQYCNAQPQVQYIIVWKCGSKRRRCFLRRSGHTFYT